MTQIRTHCSQYHMPSSIAPRWEGIGIMLVFLCLQTLSAPRLRAQALVSAKPDAVASVASVQADPVVNNSSAQSQPQAYASEGGLTGETSRIVLALTYATSHSFQTNTQEFWLQGGSLSLNAHFFHGIGVAASVTGLENQSQNSTVASVNLVAIAFGPSYTIRLNRRVSFYGEALLGEAHGFHSLFAYGSGPTSSPLNGTTDSANALAFQGGCALDFRLSQRFALRAIQIDYLRTQLPNGGNDIQNNLRIASGVVFKFSH